MPEKQREPASKLTKGKNRMEDLSGEMMPGKPVSRKMRALLDKEKIEARKRVIERGIVHFRADSEFMEALLATAERSKVAPGTLCRRIVWDYLQSLRPSQGVAEGRGSYVTNRDEIIGKLEQIQTLIEKSLQSRPTTKSSSRKTGKR
jgi:hypothetical protein